MPSQGWQDDAGSASPIDPEGQAKREHKPTEPRLTTDCPAVQATHGVAGLLSASVEPTAQRKPEQGPELPAGSNEPVGHATHGVAGFESVSDCPAGQVKIAQLPNDA